MSAYRHTHELTCCTVCGESLSVARASFDGEGAVMCEACHPVGVAASFSRDVERWRRELPRQRAALTLPWLVASVLFLGRVLELW